MTTDREPTIPEHYYAVLDESICSDYNGTLAINVADLFNYKKHPDARRYEGCCGSAGINGPNALCAGGHEVAIIRDDCWMSHHVVMSGAILQMEDDA